MPCAPCGRAKRRMSDSRTAAPVASASKVTYIVKTSTRTTAFSSLFEAQRYAEANNGKITTS